MRTRACSTDEATLSLLTSMEQALHSTTFSRIAIGVGAPALRPDVLLSMQFHTDDAKLVERFLSNRFPPELDAALVHDVFEPLIDSLHRNAGLRLRRSSADALALLEAERRAPSEQLVDDDAAAARDVEDVVIPSKATA